MIQVFKKYTLLTIEAVLYLILLCIIYLIFSWAAGLLHSNFKYSPASKQARYLNKYTYTKNLYKSLKSGVRISDYKSPLNVFTYNEKKNININNVNIQEVNKLIEMLGKDSTGSKFLKINIINKKELPPQYLWSRIVGRARLLNLLKNDGLINKYPINFKLVCSNIRNPLCNNNYEGITLAKLYFQTENWNCSSKGGRCLTGIGSITYDLGNVYYNYPASFNINELLLWKKMKLAKDKSFNVEKYFDKNIGVMNFGKMIKHQSIKN
jgi:hypothetical protein